MKNLKRIAAIVMIMIMAMAIAASAQEITSNSIRLPSVKKTEPEVKDIEAQEEEAPAEETETEAAPDEEPAEEETETETAERRVEITANVEEGETVESGTRLYLHAKLYGFENDTYTLQWQVSENGSDFHDIPGATGLNYSVIMTEDNENCRWRLEVNS